MTDILKVNECFLSEAEDKVRLPLSQLLFNIILEVFDKAIL